MSINEHPPHHVPVLLNASLELLDPQEGESYLDLTAGYGGHARAFLAKTKTPDSATLVDRDDYAIDHLGEFASQGTRLVHSDFLSAARQLVTEHHKFDLILVDLGVSSPQLDMSQRGFSFRENGPLDMRMDQNQPLDATSYLEQVSESELASVIHRYGEETVSVARRYAAAIKAAGPITTTTQLANIVAENFVGRPKKHHPATRTFQAIRIAVNDELGQIEGLLPLLPKLLNSDGRVGIISFHSLEDRLVKQYFAGQVRAGYEAELRLLNKRPREGSEDVSNPRARSAKLRAAIKI